MAKIRLLKNIFDASDIDFHDLNRKMTVKDFLYSIQADKLNLSSGVEIYNPQTNVTSYRTVTDDPSEDMVVTVCVNGQYKDVNYEMKETDLVAIGVHPASKNAMKITGGIGLAVAAVGLIALSVYTGGLAAAAGIATWKGVALYGLSAISLAASSLALNGAIALVGDAISGDNDSSHTDDSGESNPSISGSKNQPLSENAFPLVMGDVYATPFIVGSPYNEFEYDYDDDGNIIFTDEDGNLKSNILGSVQPMYEMLAVGYAPLFINNIKLDELNFAYNSNKILVGDLSYKMTDDGTVATINGDEIINVDGSKSTEREIGESWNSNKSLIEISQFGENRNIYKNVVKQKEVGSALLYCYSGQYSSIATEETITWQGGTFPAGMRTNTIKFTDGVPWKIAVGIDYPSGLYETYGDSDGNTYYKKIPMNIVVQWRPYYRYVQSKNLDSKTGSQYAINVQSGSERKIYRLRKKVTSTIATSRRDRGIYFEKRESKSSSSSSDTSMQFC